MTTAAIDQELLALSEVRDILFEVAGIPLHGLAIIGLFVATKRVFGRKRAYCYDDLIAYDTVKAKIEQGDAPANANDVIGKELHEANKKLSVLGHVVNLQNWSDMALSVYDDATRKRLANYARRQNMQSFVQVLTA